MESTIINNNNDDDVFAAPPKWLSVVLADFTGFVEGFFAGYKGCGLIAPVPKVQFWCGIGSGILVGAYSSVKQADKSNTSKLPTYNPTANSHNQYDYIGYNHYNLINYTNLTGAETIEDFYFTSKEYLLSDNIIQDSSYLIPYNTFLSTMDTLEIRLGMDYSNMLSSLNDMEISSITKSILIDYMEALESSIVIIDFVNYSISAEEIVSNIDEIEELDKIIILGAMSTARYGTQYWGL